MNVSLYNAKNSYVMQINKRYFYRVFHSIYVNREREMRGIFFRIKLRKRT